jgi:hypothetical protein
VEWKLGIPFRYTFAALGFIGGFFLGSFINKSGGAAAQLVQQTEAEISQKTKLLIIRSVGDEGSMALGVSQFTCWIVHSVCKRIDDRLSYSLWGLLRIPRLPRFFWFAWTFSSLALVILFCYPLHTGLFDPMILFLLASWFLMLTILLATMTTLLDSAFLTAALVLLGLAHWSLKTALE